MATALSKGLENITSNDTPKISPQKVTIQGFLGREGQVRRVIAFIFLLLFCSAQGQSQPLSPLDQFRQRIAVNWKPPKGFQTPIEINIRLKPDGTLASPPKILTRGTGPQFIAARDAAVKAILRSAPFDMFKPENYTVWRELPLVLDPRR